MRVLGRLAARFILEDLPKLRRVPPDNSGKDRNLCIHQTDEERWIALPIVVFWVLAVMRLALSSCLELKIVTSDTLLDHMLLLLDIMGERTVRNIVQESP